MDSEELINLVREEDILYNFNSKKYSDANEKERTWRTIAAKLNRSVQECKKQWFALRDGYRKNKRKQMTKSDNAATQVRKWKFEDEMSFLDPFLMDKKKMPFIVQESVTNSKDIKVPAKQEGPSNPQKRRRKEKPTTEIVDHVTKNKEEEKDDVDAFFHGLAQTVKNMSPYYRALTKARVGSVVSEMEIQSIVNPNPTLEGRTISYDDVDVDEDQKIMFNSI